MIGRPSIEYPISIDDAERSSGTNGITGGGGTVGTGDGLGGAGGTVTGNVATTAVVVVELVVDDEVDVEVNAGDEVVVLDVEAGTVLVVVVLVLVDADVVTVVVAATLARTSVSEDSSASDEQPVAEANSPTNNHRRPRCTQEVCPNTAPCHVL